MSYCQRGNWGRRREGGGGGEGGGGREGGGRRRGARWNGESSVKQGKKNGKCNTGEELLPKSQVQFLTANVIFPQNLRLVHSKTLF